MGAILHADRTSSRILEVRDDLEWEEECDSRGMKPHRARFLRFASARTPRGEALENPATILQFTSGLYFVEEAEGHATIDIMRLGSTNGRVACWFNTEDGSGKDGERYEAVACEVVLEDGEIRKSVEVPIIQSTRWAATLEFRITLSRPQNCALGTYLCTCRVKVIDCDTFPSDKYPEVAQGLEAIQSLDNLAIFWEYCKMNFNIEGIAWRSVVCLVFDQMKNAYIFYKLRAITYMFNTLLNSTDDANFTIDQRTNQGVLIGLGYILPMILLHVWDLVKVQLDIVGHSRCFLQQNIVRKYLNYNEDSRGELANEVTDIELAVREDAADIAEGYMAVLSILTSMGKLTILTYFLLIENPSALKYVIIMPALMAIFGCCRHERMAEASEIPDSLSSDLLAYVGDLSRNYTLIANYHQRPKINDEFARKTFLSRRSATSPAIVAVNNDYFTQWLGPTFVGVYIMAHVREVLTNKLGRGTFIAAIGVFGEISGAFSDGYKEFLKIGRLAGALEGMTVILNRPTDLLSWKAINRSRRYATKAARETIIQQVGVNHPYPTDLIPIECRDMGYGYPGAAFSLHNVNLSAPQGSIIAVRSMHGVGKQTFLRLIAHEIFPSEGEVFIPIHLRILPVSQQCFILRMSVLQNLTFGCNKVEHERVMSILTSLGATKIQSLVQEELNSSGFASHVSHALHDTDEHDDELESLHKITEQEYSWIKHLNYTEQVKLHLARAFLMDPDVMVLQRPFLHFHEHEENGILRMFCDHIHQHGLAMPEETISIRRPRTIFFSVESQNQADIADQVWSVVAEGNLSTVQVDRNHRLGRSPDVVGKNLDESGRPF